MTTKINQTPYLALIKEELKDKDELMEELKLKLNFPDYFGSNWDALFDCLCDLSWIHEGVIIIKHRDIPKLSIQDLEIYKDILQDAIYSWNDDETHKLIVEFPTLS